MTPSARREDIMKAGFVRCKNILVQCDKKLDSRSGILRIINIFNLLELSLKAQKMECKVKWVGPDGMSFVAETESGHAFVMDGAPEGGGRNLGPRPMETVLAGTGGCTAYDVVLILKKSGQNVSGCEVRLTSERAETDPKVFTKIHMHFVLRGRDLKPSTVESETKLAHALRAPGEMVGFLSRGVRERGLGVFA